MTTADNVIADTLRRSISELMGEDFTDLPATAHLQDDVGMDSLDLVELVMTAEDKFGIELPTELGDDATVGNFVTAIAIAVAAKTPAAAKGAAA